MQLYESYLLLFSLFTEKRLPAVAVVPAVQEAVVEVEAEAKVVSEVLAVVAEVQSEVLALVQKEAEVKAEAEVPVVMMKKVRQKKRVKKTRQNPVLLILCSCLTKSRQMVVNLKSKMLRKYLWKNCFHCFQTKKTKKNRMSMRNRKSNLRIVNQGKKQLTLWKSLQTK